MRTKHSDLNVQPTSNLKDGGTNEDMEVSSSEGEEEDDESMGRSSESCQGSESVENDFGVCEFGGLSENI